MKRAVLIVIVAASVAAFAAPAKTERNAALRYWMAFAMMQDPPADPATTQLLEQVANGDAPWDENRLGKIMDANTDAVLTMQRGTALPECDWGLESDLGPEMPLYHLSRARVLARLNALYAVRAIANHRQGDAVRAWKAGIRFSQQMADGSSFIGALTGRTALIAQLRTIRANVSQIDSASAKLLEAAIAQMPAGAFDWKAALQEDTNASATALRQMSAASDPRALYARWFGSSAPADFRAPTAGDITAYQQQMERAASAVEANDQLAVQATEAKIRGLSPAIAAIVPNLSKIVVARQQLEDERQQTVAALRARAAR